MVLILGFNQFRIGFYELQIDPKYNKEAKLMALNTFAIVLGGFPVI